MLFAENGYDNTTAAEIAEAANVTERTFFLHFPTKADAFAALEPSSLEGLYSGIIDQPASSDDLTALESAVIEWYLGAGDLAEVHRTVQLVHAASASSATLRGRQYDGTYAMASITSKALAARHHLAEPTLEMEVTSQVVMRIWHAILTAWVAGPPLSLLNVAQSHFEALHRAAGTWAKSGR